MKNVKLSFEFFPPKTTEGVTKLTLAAQDLKAAHPHFFSVTFGAGGSTRQGTLEAALQIKHQTHIEVAPHISCVGTDRAEIIDILHEYKDKGITRLVALRGDLPSGMGQPNGLRFACELVELIRDTTGQHFHIEVAAYPEFHPQAQDTNQDILNFKRKIEAGANSAITQYFYNADAYFKFLDECEKHNIIVPVVPGIMPITNYSSLLRFSQLCGAEIPRWILKRMETYQNDNHALSEFGTEVVYRLCEQLLEGGAPGFHFYTLNNAEPTIQILQLLNMQTNTHHSLLTVH